MDPHGMPSSPIPPKPTLEQLRHVVNNHPLIDNHAHNLLLPSHIDTVPFESITSEAQGRALRDAFKSLPHLRAARQLRELYKCSEDADWEDILEQREEWLKTDPERLTHDCFAGTHALLMDDGLAGPDRVYNYDWHDRYTKAPTKRIVRIETVAERLMKEILRDAEDVDLRDEAFFIDTWVNFTEDFEREIQEAIKDGEVAGFKTVICYRTGLDIEADYLQAAKEVGEPFERYVRRCIRKRKYRIEKKALNDYLVLRTLEILSEHIAESDGLSKPIQLHTGLGDNDIPLRESDPSFLQPLVENYPRVPFVLLHSAYPYTRQAGYLATVYKHVYLDIGEVFPMVSRDGQRAILRQALELVPGSKLLYSTDGHWFPETYWLANKQFREVWLDLLTEYLDKGDLTAFQAINLTKDLLFNNSNLLYKLHYQADFQELVEAPKSIAWRHHPDALHEPTPIAPPIQPFGSEQVSPSFPPPPKVPQVYDLALLETFIHQHPSTKFIYVQWLDYMATVRCRIIPIKEFTRMIHAGERIGISQGNTGTLQNDNTTPIVNPVGQIYVEPDLRSLRPTHKKDPLPSATVLSYWRDSTGHPLPSCPRSILEIQINDLQYNHGISLTLGFEIEVTFLRRNPSSNPSDPPYTPLTSSANGHAWGTLTPSDFLQLPMLSEIAESLEEIGIVLQQFHSESGAGQYEFILAPLPALHAIDTLIQARQVIHQIAAMHDLRATLHPQPFPGGIGTAAHVHISLEPPTRDKTFFVGGVLEHLTSICAFSMPEAESYARVKDDAWTGGTWIAWGTQNRETPLRRVCPGRWEIRCIDGFANMYLALSGIVAAGLLGIKSHPMTKSLEGVEEEPEFLEKDVSVNPSTLTEEQREEYGISERMPVSVEEALRALEGDGEMKEGLGELVGSFLVMKRCEVEMLGRMEDGERRVWLVERY